jgi:hypothetical protein
MILSHALRASNGAIDVTYLGRFDSASAAGTTISFSSVNFGIESATRRIYISILANPATSGPTATLTSATIDGNSATIIAENPSSTASITIQGLIAVALPTGTSGTVTLTFSQNIFAASGVIFVYGVTNQTSSIATALVQEVSVLQLSSTTSESSSVSTASGGFMIGTLATLFTVDNMTYTNMPINSGSASATKFTGLQTNTSGSSTTYGFSWTVNSPSNRYFVSLKG